jgi:SAM-dependent methyltransferase
MSPWKSTSELPHASVPAERGSMTAEHHGFDPSAYWERRLQPFDLSVVGHSGLGLRYNRWLYRVRAAVFRRLLRTISLSPDARVLDVGSGTGFYIREWQRAGVADIVGSDLTAIAVEGLTARFPGIEIVSWDVADEPPFEPASFDAVSAFDVLFHIVDDGRYRAALANLASLLRSGGLLLVSENLVHGQAVVGEHQVSRSLSTIEAMLREAGLEIVTRRPMFVLMSIPIDSQSRWHWRFWNRLYGLLLRRPRLGGIVGMLLFPVELGLLLLCREGPSTEVLVYRRMRNA